MSIDAMKQALEALWDCTVKLESQQFRNPVQIPPVYSDIIKAGYSAHAALRADIEAAERQEPVACQYAKDVGMPEYRCVGKCQYAAPQPTIPAWQPIETAPDEQGIDVWIGSIDNPNFGVRVTSVHRIGSRWFGIPDYYNTERVKTTHWMPLPAAPKEPK